MQRGCPNRRWRSKGGATGVLFGPIWAFGGVFRPISPVFGARETEKCCASVAHSLTWLSAAEETGPKGSEAEAAVGGEAEAREGGDPGEGFSRKPKRRGHRKRGPEAGAVPGSAETATAARSLDAAEGPGRPGRSDRWRHRAGEETGSRLPHIGGAEPEVPDHQRDEAPARVVCCPPGASFISPGLARGPWRG